MSDRIVTETYPASDVLLALSRFDELVAERLSARCTVHARVSSSRWGAPEYSGVLVLRGPSGVMSVDEVARAAALVAADVVESLGIRTGTRVRPIGLRVSFSINGTGWGESGSEQRSGVSIAYKFCAMTSDPVDD